LPDHAFDGAVIDQPRGVQSELPRIAASHAASRFELAILRLGLALGAYDPGQLRVPGGTGAKSGRWISDRVVILSRFGEVRVCIHQRRKPWLRSIWRQTLSRDL
jgi:hypothetical protein